MGRWGREVAENFIDEIIFELNFNGDRKVFHFRLSEHHELFLKSVALNLPKEHI